MDVETIGERMCEQLHDAGLVATVADFYTLTRDQLLALPGVGGKSADKMLTSIEISKKQPFWRLLFALGIRHIGEKAAQILATAFPTLDGLLEGSEQEISAIAGIGPVAGRSLFVWLNNAQNRALLDRLRAAGLAIRSEEQVVVTGPLSGQTFLLTGRLKKMTRPQAEEAIQRLGGTVAPGVSKTLSHLIVGEEAGSKLTKAQKARVPIHDELWLLDLLGFDGSIS